MHVIMCIYCCTTCFTCMTIHLFVVHHVFSFFIFTLFLSFDSLDPMGISSRVVSAAVYVHMYIHSLSMRVVRRVNYETAFFS